MNAAKGCFCALIFGSLLLTGSRVWAQEETPVKGYAELNGTRLFYEVAGKGSTVVLVHGGLVDSRLWDDQIKAFERHHRVVRYDLRGFGRSAAATEPFSHVDDLRALFDFLKIDRATVVGLSLGGIVASDFTLEYPQRIERLVLSGPGLRGDQQPPDKKAIAAYQAASQGAEAFVKAAMNTSLFRAVRPGTKAYTRLREMMLDNFKALSTLAPGFVKYPEPKTIARVDNVRVPTLIIIGSEDAPSLKNIADALHSKITSARKAVIRGVSHHPPVEAPAKFNRIVMNFLRTQTNRATVSKAAGSYPYRLVNVMPTFWRFWEQTRGKDKETRVRLFREMVVEPHKEIYALARSGLDDQGLAEYLDNVQSHFVEMRRFSEALPARLYQRWKTFSTEFPDTRGATLYIVPAPQNAIGGWVRPFGSRDVVIFGFDSLADISSETEFSVFVHHELTHLYHAQVNPEFRAMTESFFMKKGGEPASLYQLVWLEGLATYVSRVLNPNAPMGEIINQKLTAQIQARLPQLARELLEQLDSTDMQVIVDFVFDGNESKGIPRKTAYYLGMLVAQELGKTHTLNQLLRLQGKGLRYQIEEVLRRLESGAGGRSGACVCQRGGDERYTRRLSGFLGRRRNHLPDRCCEWKEVLA